MAANLPDLKITSSSPHPVHSSLGATGVLVNNKKPGSRTKYLYRFGAYRRFQMGKL
jgi:hypothetical protein